MTKKKRAAIMLPITPEEFTPIFGLIKLRGKDVGAEALECLKERYAAELANLPKLSANVGKQGGK